MASLLVLTVLLPLVGALVLFARPAWDYRVGLRVGLGTPFAALALSLLLILNFRSSQAGPQFAFGPKFGPYGVAWMSLPGSSGIRFALGLDGVSLGLFALTALLMITSIFAS